MSTVHRIALISSSFAPHVGGVETHVAKVAEELTRSGHAVEVWAVDRGERSSRAGSDRYRLRYLPTPLPARDLRSLFQVAVRAPRAWAAWRQAHKSFAPTVLHIHCFGPNGVYGSALSTMFRTPLVVTSHGETRADDGNAFDESALLRASLRHTIRRAWVVTAPSEFVLSDLRCRFGLVGGTTVPNGVGASAGRATAVSAFGSPYLLGVGRLGRIKGFDLLLQAFEVADLPDEMRLRIVGDGPELDRLKELASALGVAPRVDFVGLLDEVGVAATMADATAVVVPSRVEAFGIVALEAWRSGAPLVITNRGGAPEFVRDGEDALLVDPTQVDELAGALERVTRELKLVRRLVAAGSQRWPEFTWTRVAAQYAALYDRLVFD